MGKAKETEPDLATPQAELSDAEVIARRSADIEAKEAKNSEHVKVFVLAPGENPTKGADFDHTPNKSATRQYAISQGLRPTGDVRFVGAKEEGKHKAWWLTYAVPVIPAERASWPEQGIVAVNEGDQAELREQEQSDEQSKDDKPAK